MYLNASVTFKSGSKACFPITKDDLYPNRERLCFTSAFIFVLHLSLLFQIKLRFIV